MNDRHLISIAMATYNGDKYLIDQLDSIIAQTYKNIEIIIVDDCSRDATVDILQKYSLKYKFIKYYQNKNNLGITKTFERAINLCRGKYIALSDQDDIWFLEKLEVLSREIGDNLLIHSDAVLINNKKNIICKSHFKSIKDPNKKEFIDYLWSNNMHGCTAMINRKLVDLCFPIPDNFYVHDHYLAICAVFYGSIKLYLQPLIYYRQHSNNVTGAYKKNYLDFIKYCNTLAVSYNSLLIKKDFKNNFKIKIVRDYRQSLYIGKWKSDYNIFFIFRLKDGWKHFIFFILFTFIINRFSNKLYIFIRKFV